MADTTGSFDPVGAANALAPTAYTPSTFVAANSDAINYAATQLKVDPSVIAGQWGEETGWGKSVIPGTNNFSNIKSTNNQGVSATDNQTGSTDKYQQYSDPMNFAQNYVKLIQNRYPDAIGAPDAQTFGTTLQKGGYAQDPKYGSKLANAATTALAFISGSGNANASENSTSFDPVAAASSLPGLTQTPQAQQLQYDPYGDNTAYDAQQAQAYSATANGPQNPAGGVGTTGVIGHANTAAAGLLGGIAKTANSLNHNLDAGAAESANAYAPDAQYSDPNNAIQLPNTPGSAASYSPPQSFTSGNNYANVASNGVVPIAQSTAQQSQVSTAAGQAQRQGIQNWQNANGGQTTTGKVADTIGQYAPYFLIPGGEGVEAAEGAGMLAKGAASAFNGVKTLAQVNAAQSFNDTLANGGSSSDAATAAAKSAADAISNPWNWALGPVGDVVGAAAGKAISAGKTLAFGSATKAVDTSLTAAATKPEIQAAAKIKNALDTNGENSAQVAQTLQQNGQSAVPGVQRTAGEAVVDPTTDASSSPILTTAEQGATASPNGNVLQATKQANQSALDAYGVQQEANFNQAANDFGTIGAPAVNDVAGPSQPISKALQTPNGQTIVNRASQAGLNDGDLTIADTLEANKQATVNSYNEAAFRSPTTDFNNQAKQVASATGDVHVPVEPGDIKGMYDARDKLTAPLYDNAIANAKSMVPVDDNLKSLLQTPAGQTAVRNVEGINANNLIERPSVIQNVPATNPTTGAVYQQSIHPADLQMIKQELDTQARFNPTNPASANAQQAILNVKEGVNNVLKNQVPGYTAANDAYRHLTAPIKASELLDNPAVRDAIAKGGPGAITRQLEKIGVDRQNPMSAASQVSQDTIDGLTSLRDQLLHNKTMGIKNNPAGINGQSVDYIRQAARKNGALQPGGQQIESALAAQSPAYAQGFNNLKAIEEQAARAKAANIKTNGSPTAEKIGARQSYENMMGANANLIDKLTGDGGQRLARLATAPFVGLAHHFPVIGPLVADYALDKGISVGSKALKNAYGSTGPQVMQAGADLLSNAPKLGKLIDLLNQKQALQAAKEAANKSTTKAAQTVAKGGLLGTFNYINNPKE